MIASGLYHGVNPGMGWPLALSAGLMEKRSGALLAALWPLAIGHLLAILLVILPFSLLVALVEWQRPIQVGASLLVIGFGVFRLIDRRHPRALARIPPTQLGLWSFAVAIAHGAGLMLVPIYLGLCRTADLDAGHVAASTLINANLGMALLVSAIHAVAMIAAGGSAAWLVYRYLGLKFVSRSWFNLDADLGVQPDPRRRRIARVQPCLPAVRRSPRVNTATVRSRCGSAPGPRHLPDTGIQAVPDIDQADLQDQRRKLGLLVMPPRLVPDRIGHRIGAVIEPGDRLGECQRRALGVGEKRRMPPSGDGENAVVGLARLFQLQRMHVNARATAVNLAGAEMHEFARDERQAIQFGGLVQRVQGLHRIGKDDYRVLHSWLHG